MAQFQVTFEDARFRVYRVTFERAAKGTFPKLVKIERYRTNGKDHYFELHRPSIYGPLEAHTLEKIEEAKRFVRFQA